MSGRASGDDTSQTTPGIGRHCQKSRARAAFAASTYVDRSTCRETTVVHRRLNPGRAITLCCTAKTPSRATSITSAGITPLAGPPRSTVRGTTTSATKATAYRKSTTKDA